MKKIITICAIIASCVCVYAQGNITNKKVAKPATKTTNVSKKASAKATSAKNNALNAEKADRLNQEANALFETDKKAAFDLYMQAAELGNAAAQCSVGHYYYLGWNGVIDKEKAFQYYSKSAHQGDMHAQYFLGQAYLRGEGTEQNREAAYEWYGKSAEQGNIHAKHVMVNYYRFTEDGNKDQIKAMQMLKQMAEDGDVDSMYQLGDDFERGWWGVPQDFDESVKWYKRAYEGKKYNACSHMGRIYLYSDWSEKNPEEGIKWLKIGSENNDGDSQVALAEEYITGQFITQDFQEARKLLEKAKANGGNQARISQNLDLIGEDFDPREREKKIKGMINAVHVF